jgi:hypothetical protein
MHCVKMLTALMVIFALAGISCGGGGDIRMSTAYSSGNIDNLRKIQSALIEYGNSLPDYASDVKYAISRAKGEVRWDEGIGRIGEWSFKPGVWELSYRQEIARESQGRIEWIRWTAEVVEDNGTFRVPDVHEIWVRGEEKHGQ